MAAASLLWLALSGMFVCRDGTCLCDRHVLWHKVREPAAIFLEHFAHHDGNCSAMEFGWRPQQNAARVRLFTLNVLFRKIEGDIGWVNRGFLTTAQFS